MKFLKDKSGVFAIFFAILAPIVFAFMFFSFDVVNIFSKKSNFDNALRESSILNANLDDDDKKEQINKALSKFYLNNENLDLEFNQSSYLEDEKNILDFSAIAPVFSLFKNNEKSEIYTQVGVLPGSTNADGSYTDYAFVIDYSASMLKDTIDLQETRKEFCNKNNDNYDKDFCTELAPNLTMLKMSQIVTKKLLKDIIKADAKEVYYSLIPFTFGTQSKKKFYYQLGSNKSETLGNFFHLGVAFKDEYELSDYNLYSGMFSFDKTHASIGGGDKTVVLRTYEKDLEFIKEYLHKNEIKKAQKLFNLLRPNIIQGAILDDRLDEIVDINKSLKNMFDLDKSFSYRFFTDIDGVNIDTNKDVKDENYRPYGIAYDVVPERSIDYSPRMLDGYVNAYELALKKLSKEIDKEFLSYLDWTPAHLGYSRPTFLTSGILRAAGYLAKGHNKRKAMIIITDGAKDYSDDLNYKIPALDYKFLKSGMCEKIKSGLKKRGAKDVDIFIINLSQNNDSAKEFINDWQHCTGKDKTAVINDFKEFYKTFKDYALGRGKNSTKFIYKDN